MKIIYDISVLGMAHYHQRSRTGIARAIENIAVGLKRGGDCELTFCAHRMLSDFIQVRRYLQTVPEICDVPLVGPSDALLNHIVSTFDSFYPNPPRIAVYRIVRKVLSVMLNSLGARHDSIDPAALFSTDIFHSTFYPVPAFTRQKLKIRNFITVYDLIPILHPQYFSSKRDHVLHDVMRSITPDDWVIAISQSTKNDLCDYLKFDPARVFVTHLAASDRFHPCTDSGVMQRARAKYRIPDGPYILSLSTLEPRKNIDHTIRCFARLVREENIRDLSLVLVGTKGWDFDRIFGELTNHDQLRDRIIVTGYVADEDLAAIYSGARMFVYPSFYEGFGLPPLEAMQCGVPVITSNTSSLPEVVGNAGLMVDPKDADALCQAMFDIYRRSPLRDDLASRAIERARSFSWDACARGTVRAYRTALGQRIDE